MKRIDTISLKPYYKEDNDAQIAKVGHVNAVIEAVSTDFDGVLIDPTLNSGISVYTQFVKNELITTVAPGTSTRYDVYKLVVVAELNDPSTSIYDLYIGNIVSAPGTIVSVAGVQGDVTADIPFIFGTANFASEYTTGASVLDVGGPAIAQLTNADVYGFVNPFDTKEYLLGMYAASTADFQCNVTLEVNIAITAGATIQYSRD